MIQFQMNASAQRNAMNESVVGCSRLQVEMEGLTGFIKFDPQGMRTFFHLAIVELTENGLSVVGTWNANGGANFTRTPIEAPPLMEESLTNKTLIVTSKLVST